MIPNIQIYNAIIKGFGYNRSLNGIRPEISKMDIVDEPLLFNGNVKLFVIVSRKIVRDLLFDSTFNWYKLNTN